MSTEALLDTEPSALPGAATVAVMIARDADAIEWDRFVGEATGTGYHVWAWRELFERTFGHECIYLMARQDGVIRGVLPLVYLRSPVFGRMLTSLPFLNYGGVVAQSTDVAGVLIDAAAEEARARQCRHIELRHVTRQFPNLPCRQHKVAMLLPLQAGMWERVDRKVRNQIRKAEKSSLTCEQGGGELVADFYTVFARNMRDLGTPVYTRRLFDEVLRLFGERARIHVVRLNSAPVAAGLTYRTGGTVEVPWASSIREHNPRCPNHLLYWSIIEAAVAAGCDQLDFGRSTPDEGTYKFKEQWGARPRPLYWEYRLLEGHSVPDQSPRNPKFRAAVALWKRCPLWFTNAIGPHIVRSIP